MTALVSVNQLFVEAVDRIHRRLALAVLRDGSGTGPPLDAGGMTLVLAFVDQALNSVPIAAIAVETAGNTVQAIAQVRLGDV